MGRNTYYTPKQMAVLAAIASFYEENEFAPRTSDIAEITGLHMSNLPATLKHLEFKGNIVMAKDTNGGGKRIVHLDHPDFCVWTETDEMRNVLVGT
jgi:DNA-binding MarR family transcriptional regulator